MAHLQRLFTLRWIFEFITLSYFESSFGLCNRLNRIGGGKLIGSTATKVSMLVVDFFEV